MNDDLKTIEQNVNIYLQFAEAKNAVLITFNGALALFAFDYFSELNKGYEKTVIAGLVIVLIITIIINLISFIPYIHKHDIIKRPGDPRDDDNLLYYKHISKYDHRTYYKALYNKFHTADTGSSNIKIDNYESSLSRQIVELSKIAYNKYFLFNLSLKITLVVLLFLIAIVISA